MAATTKNVPNTEDVIGSRLKVRIIDLTGDAAYPTGGYKLTAQQFGFKQLVGIIPIGANAAGALLLADFINTTSKLLISYPSGGGAASPAALADPAITAGAVAVTSNAANGANDLTPGRGKEVANNTDLSTVTLRLLAIGY